jgi:hypothetical protein
MKRTFNITLRAALAVAVVLLAVFAMSRRAMAQDNGTAYDVKASSAADGAAGEYPLTYTVNYDNGTSQQVAIAADGVSNFNAPIGAVNPVSIVFLGQVFPVQTFGRICLPPNPQGGCWCLCLQWVRVFPWWRIPRFFWYYSPCC